MTRVLRALAGLALVAIVVTAAAGCTHSLEVKNLNAYNVFPTSGPRMDIAIRSVTYSGDTAAYCRAIQRALTVHPHVGQVRTDWNPEQQEDGFNPSHIVDLRVTPKYDGSPANFIITFPGFLVFACAWNGYEYAIRIDTQVSVSPVASADASGKLTSRSEHLPISFDVRHCSYSRGFWSGTGWWFPGYGIHNVITGIVFQGYDDTVTQPFLSMVEPRYGDYVAEKIVQCLISAGGAAYAREAGSRTPSSTTMGSNETATPKLGGGLGKVAVECNEPGAEIRVDGRLLGNAPATLTLMPGPHIIELWKNGFARYSREITVLADSQVTLAGELTK